MVVAYYKKNMKAKTIEEAKRLAKNKSLKSQNKDEAIYIIYCNRTGLYYAETNSLIRNWEELIGYYENGVYTSDNNK